MTADISTHPPRVEWDILRIFCSSSICYFNPPTPCGVGPSGLRRQHIRLLISIHPPRVGWDYPLQRPRRPESDFNPPTPCGVGRLRQGSSRASEGFQSTHPVWGGTWGIEDPGTDDLISIHPPRVGWDAAKLPDEISPHISIHPPRVGWDAMLVSFAYQSNRISIHPPRVGWDVIAPQPVRQAKAISIHPPRVGWDRVTRQRPGTKIISIHPPRVGWDYFYDTRLDELYISIHPPRVGWDAAGEFVGAGWIEFQSTHPVWGGTFTGRICGNGRRHFNPPTPCGVGPTGTVVAQGKKGFQSTHPVWGGTWSECRGSSRLRFQSTHPVWGGTAKVHKTGRRTFAQIIKYMDIPPVFQLSHRVSRRFLRILSQLFCANRAGRACPLPLRTP